MKDSPHEPSMIAGRCEQLAPCKTQEDSTGIKAGGEDERNARKCHEALAAQNAHAVIPPRKNTKHWKPTSADITAEVASKQKSIV